MALRDIKDLLLIALFGFIYYALVIGLLGELYSVPQLSYFLIPTIVPFFLGFSIKHAEQVLEWPLAFLFGGAMASLTLMLLLSVLGAPLNLPHFSLVLRNTILWYGLMSALWILALIFGFFIQATLNIILGSIVR